MIWEIAHALVYGLGGAGTFGLLTMAGFGVKRRWDRDLPTRREPVRTDALPGAEGLATEELLHPGLTAWMRTDGRGVTGLAVEREQARNPELPDWRGALDRIIATYAAVEWERNFATLAAPARALPERIGQVSGNARDTPTDSIDGDAGSVGTYELRTFVMQSDEGPVGSYTYDPSRPNAHRTLLCKQLDREIERLHDDLARAGTERQTAKILAMLHEVADQRRRVAAGILDWAD